MEGLKQLATADVVIHLTRQVAGAGIYPAVDLRSSRSRLLETAAVGDAHRAIAMDVRRTLGAALWNRGDPPSAVLDRLMHERARKLQNYFAQPFYAAESFSERSGTRVGIDEALRTCRDILEGRHDDIPEQAFYFAGGIEEIRTRSKATG